ncbi:type VI secretion system baseplate subunit TssK [Francisella philomiragia]|uniref:type VI secretion system baseplate subunit TssK n=1 Tax=Francisella philomiragia TaxID=28110 RepID=UPI00351544AE
MQQINWYLGQSVLPEHFTLSQHLSNQRNIKLCEVNSATNFYGLAELKIDENLFNKNILRIESLLYITLTSENIFYQRNSSQNRLELNLNNIEESKVDIILNVGKEPLTIDIEGNNTKIRTKLPNLSLLVNPEQEEDGIRSFKILSLDKKEDGRWILSDFLPPLLTTDVYSFCIISNMLSSLIQTICSYGLNEKARNSTLSEAKSVLLNNIVFECNKLQYSFWQLKTTKCHPIDIFYLVQNIYLYLLQYQDIVDLDSDLIYDHERVFKSFQNLTNTILDRIVHTKAVDYIVLKNINGYLSTGVIEFGVLNRKKHYIVIRKPTENYSYLASNIKLTSPGRIEYVNKYAMTGLKLNKLDFNPLPSSGIDKYCDVYEILPSREWDYILNEQAICVLNNNLSELKFIYYYV